MLPSSRLFVCPPHRDRNRDGDISKQEFRLHTKKLGLEASTADIDALYDSLDLDGSGSLDTDEMKEALKRMKDNVKHVKASVELVIEAAKDLAATAPLLRAAAEDMHLVEAARLRLETMRQESKDDSTISKVVAIIKAKNLKIGDIVVGWDKTGHGVRQADFCRGFLELGSDVPEAELRNLFLKLDVDGSGILEADEVTHLLAIASKASSVIAAKAAKAAEADEKKIIAKLVVAAEASQKVARAAVEEAKVRAAAMNEAKSKAAAAEAKVKADEAAEKKKSNKAVSIAKFMTPGTAENL